METFARAVLVNQDRPSEGLGPSRLYFPYHSFSTVHTIHFSMPVCLTSFTDDFNWELL